MNKQKTVPVDFRFVPPIQVWLKRRKNPAKRDGTRTISYTLQWKDEEGKDRYESLGSRITEEEAERLRDEFEHKVNLGGTSTIKPRDEPVDLEHEVTRLRAEAPADYETLVAHFGNDPRSWGVWQMHYIDKWGYRSDWRCDRLRKMAATLRGEIETEFPPFVRFRLGWHHPKAHDQLLDYFGSQDAFEDEIQKRLEESQDGDTLNVQPVIDGLLELAKDVAWSNDSAKFERQFRERYPEEYEKLVSEGLVVSNTIKASSMPPEEVVERLLLYARRGESKERMARPKTYWGGSPLVEQAGESDDDREDDE